MRRRRSSKVPGARKPPLLHGGDHGPLALLHVALEHLAHLFLDPLAAVDVHVHLAVVDLEDDEVGQAGHHRLGPLGQEKLLQIVVAQGGVFDVDLAHHADPYLGLPGHGDGLEGGHNAVKVGHHALEGEALALVHGLQKLSLHGLDGLVSLAPADLVGAGLVGGLYDDVAVHHGEHRLAQGVEPQLEAGVGLQARQVDRDDGDIAQTRLLQRLAQQMDVVGGPAAAAGLGDEQGHLMQVVLAALHRVDELADDQQGGVTGVVVDVLEPLVHDAPVVGGEHLHVEALGLQNPGHQAEVHRAAWWGRGWCTPPSSPW